MSNFNCEHCGTAIIDSPTGYITECEHHPKENMKNEQHTAAREWRPIDRGNTSLRWLLMRDKNGVEGIRLGRPEDSGWRLVNEWGQSTWQPHHTEFYLAEMLLNPPINIPTLKQSGGDGGSK